MAVVNVFKKFKFGDWAIKLDFMTRDQVEFAMSKKNISNQMLGRLCIEEGFIDHEQLAQIMAAQYSFPYLELKGIDDAELLKLVPVDLMTKYTFIPYKRENNKLVIAVAEPMSCFKAIDELEMLTDMDISVVVASENKVMELLKKIEASRSALDDISDDMKLSIVRETDKGEDILSHEKVSTEESPVVKLVDSTILDAINKKASDIHFETSERGMIIRYRIDGMLHQATDPLSVQYQSPVISRIKVMSELDISEKRIPQDGRFKLKVRDRHIDFRISILPTVFGEDAVIRILDREAMMPDASNFNLENTGISTGDLIRIRRMIRVPYGMFLMTGPTGSGKTTTLYMAMAEVNSKDIKIITIEDPVEYQVEGITQIQVNEKTGLTFAKGLRSILRHDPDKILVGEIRDMETAQIALQSALTGHLVFATVHANNSFEVINRFIHMGIEPYQLMSALNCIVAQRLIRTLCECKIKVKLSEDILVTSGLDPKKYETKYFYNKKGCPKCKGTGFKGRKAIIEVLELDDDFKTLFINRSPVSVIKKKALESGTIFLRQAALQEVFTGNTTLAEANRVTFIEPGSEGKP